MNGLRARALASDLLRRVSSGQKVPRSDARAILEQIVDHLTPEEDTDAATLERRRQAAYDAATLPWTDPKRRRHPAEPHAELRGKDFGLQ